MRTMKYADVTGRAPHGARGLKRTIRTRLCAVRRVAPRTGRVD
ncbi:hypothetical protein HMPREF9163_02248 [Selenomonas sp. oral taxon 138 str. F0429]|nr:hypothetical protein HMPREF9163_02248 [Selenomonas sp. oral taxon 138 str. F0429]